MKNYGYSANGIPILSLRDKVDSLFYCLEMENGGGPREDAMGHLFDLIHHIAPDYEFAGLKGIEAIAAHYGANPTPVVRRGPEEITMSEDEDFDPELSCIVAEMKVNADRRTVVIDYTNWKQIRSVRRIIPMSIRWGATEYHPEEQWLLEAFDRDKGAERTFAVRDIHSWREIQDPE